MTFPTLIDQVANAVLATEPAAENPRHRALLEAHLEVLDLDQQLAILADDEEADGSNALDQLQDLTDLLVERMAAGVVLSRLLSTACCCTEAYEEDEEAPDDVHDDELLSCPSRPKTILHACVDAFADAGDPDVMPSADLTERLRRLPGVAEERWAYADLTPTRLGRLLASYGVRTRNVRYDQRRQAKSFARDELLSALGAVSC